MSDERGIEVPAAGEAAGLVESLLRWVARKRLHVPAAMLLEMHRPLMPLAWSAAMLAGGLLAPLFGPDYYERIEALRDPACLDRILRRLQALGDEDGAA
jgi:hypothetical protein